MYGRSFASTLRVGHLTTGIPSPMGDAPHAARLHELCYGVESIDQLAFYSIYTLLKEGLPSKSGSRDGDWRGTRDLGPCMLHGRSNGSCAQMPWYVRLLPRP